MDKSTLRQFYSVYGIYSIDDLVRAYERKSSGYFFSKDAMRFFKSRLSENIYPSGAGKIYFVTSEKSDWQSPRFYTVRMFSILTGNIETIGDFQAYKSSSGANKAALREALSHAGDEWPEDMKKA